MVARRIHDEFGADTVAFEIMNEPPDEAELAKLGLRSWSTHFAPLFYRDIRQVAPNMTVIIQSSAGGWSEAIPKLRTLDFDSNTIFSFHFYTPGEFTHQGSHHDVLYGVPFPISGYVGGKDQMWKEVEARIAAKFVGDPNGEKSALQQYSKLLDYLWYPPDPLGPTWIRWPKLDNWIRQERVNPRRILCGEFGVVSDINFNGKPGTDLTSRVNYMRTVRSEVESRGFCGWVAHQAMGDFNLFEQQSISRHGYRLIPELVDALFR
jgi:hypothetical protein